jgi:tetratricopeptide (TPR) repeat protein
MLQSERIHPISNQDSLTSCSYLAERSDADQATQLLDLASLICDSAKEKADLTEYYLRIWRGRIGVAFVTRNQIEYHKYAEKCYNVEMGLERRAQLSIGLATANLHMGIAYNMNSLYQDAIPFLVESARIRRCLPGFKKDWLFSPRYQLAHSYLHLGDYKKSAELLQTAIDDRQEALGENDRFSMRLVGFNT